eukprot:TRINITY_DN37270_c0_g1_i1.p1 TRINITY_DN37270_c0_g1~~TRINITY_DN37270_c0_g1_i1.p1  ORF type:complete len:626 (-),score=78.26 TRINITY_DN37270_c0_g1_i1:28-1905(-)
MAQHLFLDEAGLFTKVPLEVCPRRPPADSVYHLQPGGGGSSVDERTSEACRCAVALVKAEYSCGSGFLALSSGEVFLLTSRYVLPDAATARSAHAIFDYEEHRRPVRVGLIPEQLFYADVELDFTIVSCDLASLDARAPLPLDTLRLPRQGSIVEIWQHPAGGWMRRAVHPVMHVRVPHLVHAAAAGDRCCGGVVFEEVDDAMCVVGLNNPSGEQSMSNIAVLVHSISRQLTTVTHSTKGRHLLEMLALRRVEDVQKHLCRPAAADGAAVAMADHALSAPTQEAACEAISRAAKAGNLDRGFITRTNGVKQILDTMGAHRWDRKVQVAACNAIADLSRANSARNDNRRAIVQTGGVERIIFSMALHETDPAVHRAACRALSELAAVRENQVDMVQAGAVERVVATGATHIGDAAMQLSVCCALRDLLRCSHTDGRRALLSAVGAVDTIILAMATHAENAALQAAACEVFRHLADRDAQGQTAVGCAGGVSSISAAMRAHSGSQAVQIGGCWALRNLAKDHRENQESILWADGLERITAAMSAHMQSAAVQEAGCCALRNMATSGIRETRDAVVRAGAAERVAAALLQHPTNREVQQAAAAALRGLDRSNLNSCWEADWTLTNRAS